MIAPYDFTCNSLPPTRTTFHPSTPHISRKFTPPLLLDVYHCQLRDDEEKSSRFYSFTSRHSRSKSSGRCHRSWTNGRPATLEYYYDGAYPYTYNDKAHRKTLVTNEENEPWDKQERKTVLTSAHTWLSRVKGRLLCEESIDRWNLKTYNLIFCLGWIIRDEFTTDKLTTKRTCQIMMDLNERYPNFKPFKVFMSGTPLNSTPTDNVLSKKHNTISTSSMPIEVMSAGASFLPQSSSNFSISLFCRFN